MSLSSSVYRNMPLEVIPEIIRQTDDPATLAAWCQVSSAHLKIAGPTLYHTITIRGTRHFLRFLKSQSQPSNPPLGSPGLQAPRLKIRFMVAHRLLTEELSEVQTPEWVPKLVPLAVPILVGDFRILQLDAISPRVIFPRDTWALPATRLAEIQRSDPRSLIHPSWDRVTDIICAGPCVGRWAIPWSNSTTDEGSGRGWADRDARVTMDLSMIDQPGVDATNPKASCQRLLEDFVRSLRAEDVRWLRGRVWVANGQMASKFEVARDLLSDRLSAGESVVAQRVRGIRIEVFKDTYLRFGM